MSVRFRQAFHDTFVRTICPSKSAIFQCTRQRTMSQMYNSMYYRNNSVANNTTLTTHLPPGSPNLDHGVGGGGRRSTIAASSLAHGQSFNSSLKSSVGFGHQAIAQEQACPLEYALIIIVAKTIYNLLLLRPVETTALRTQ